MASEDEQLARAARALRRELRLRQEDLVGRGRSVHLTHAIESAAIGHLRVDELRAHFAALGAKVRITAWWNGASLDRLIDARHAAVVERLVAVLHSLGWDVRTEVSFSEYGERGSIDVFAGRADSSAVFVGEAKSEWGSIEGTLRSHDVKTRLAPTICERVFGFKPRNIASALVFPDEMTARRIADRHEATLNASYPFRARALRRWLVRPSGPLRGVWFLSNPDTREVGIGDGDDSGRDSGETPIRHARRSRT